MLLDGEYPPDVRVENEISALAEEGHKIHLACTTRKNKPAEEHIGNVIIHRKVLSTFIYKSSVGCLRFPFYFNFWRKHVASLLKKENFDIIHVHDLPLSQIGVELKKKYNIKLVIDLHENWPGLLKNATHTQTFPGRIISSNNQWKKYEIKMLKEADLVITVVNEARDRVASLGISAKKLYVVSNSVNTDAIPVFERTREDNEFVIFYGGGLNRHRGIQVVLEAIKILKDRDVKIKLDIAGSGSYKPVLEKQTQNLGIMQNVVFHGQKSFNEMLKLLTEADAAIIPHLRNENNDATIPHKLSQYMYLNKPVISSDCIPLKRIISETGTGFIYKNNSPEELAGLLAKLYTERHLLAEKGLRGRKAVLAAYNWNIEKKKLLEAYKSAG